MYIAYDCKSLKLKLKELDRKKEKIAFVPTMGSLHEGHLALVRRAREVADFVVVSIFVNPLQFNESKDYKNYPRMLKEDIKLLEEEEVDYLFLPEEGDFYGESFLTKISIDKITDKLCGAARGSHFDGVAVVLSKFFNVIKPDYAVFGLKDYQQYLLVKKLVEDLNFDIDIIGVDTYREKSGLALSSRNENLSEDERLKIAPRLYESLKNISSYLRKGGDRNDVLREAEKEILKAGFDKIDYLEILKDDLSDYDGVVGDSRVFVAANVGLVRLIDNIKV
jgi:pantoate--beta-alanine ligase